MIIKNRKIIVALACRVDGKRLFAKPLQNLDEINYKPILDIILSQLLTFFKRKDIILAISKKKNNQCFVEYANKNKIKYFLGDEVDVLKRIITSCEKINGTDIFRVTSESPFIYLKNLKKNIITHLKGNYDLTALDNVPDGSGYEIIKLKALKNSWKNGSYKHRSEMCTLYIRENFKKFKIRKIKPPKFLSRLDLRLTVDYPEDLILCREIYKKFKKDMPILNFKKIVNFLDNNKKLKKLVSKYVNDGMKTMYL